MKSVVRALRNSDYQGSLETEPTGYACRYMREDLLRKLAHTIMVAEKSHNKLPVGQRDPSMSGALSKSEHLKTMDADDAAMGLRLKA